MVAKSTRNNSQRLDKADREGDKRLANDEARSGQAACVSNSINQLVSYYYSL